MAKYLIKILLVVLVWLYISNIYYNDFSFHKESFSGYTPYVLFILINYFIYKIYTIFLNYKEKLEFSLLGIFSIFAYQLLFFSFFFFSITNYSHNSGFIFFVNILWKLALPFLITIISYSFWNKIINLIEKKSEKKEDSKFIFLLSLWLGFSAFIFFLTIVWSLGFYNIYSVITILLLFSIISYKELFSAFKWLYTYKIEIENHNINSRSFLEKLNPYLLSTEFLFILISLLISTNFISIFRPTPIGWDDMWVYMNYPRMMADSGDLLSLWLVAWQTLTGIWFMIKSTTQAFFLNNLGSILSVIVIIISFSSLLKNSKKTFINIPMLLATIFLAMPMIVFQQAKDMKLDTGLFFISSIVIYWIIHIFLKYFWYKKDEKYIIEDKIKIPKINNFLVNLKNYFSQNIVYWNSQLFSERKYLFYIFILWIIAWFAFTIKVTTLLLVAWIFWIFFYSKLWFSGFLGYLSIFFWIFTKFSLWDYMWKINYPKNDTEFKTVFFAISVTIWITLILYSINKYKFKAFSNLLKILWIFLSWFILFLSPFFTKHISETIRDWKEITIWAIISGTSDRFKVDYTKILTKEKLEEIEKRSKEKEKKERTKWKTKNEDFGRYFWYENWINNYVKLPINLTMQKNQKWEFTDITYIFLALIPIIFLFLNFKNSFATAGILGILFLESLIFFIPVWKTFFTDFFAKSDFPFWYLILLVIFIFSLFFFLYWLKKDKNSQIFRLISVFLIFYIFLWTIAAFWVIWYWITMFYWLLLMIWIALYNISSYDETEESKVNFIKFFWSLSVFLIISIYFFNSTFPHSFKNIKKSGFVEYKANDFWDLELTFWYNPWRLEVLFALNIAENKKEKFLKEIVNNIWETNILEQFVKYNSQNKNLFKSPQKIEEILKNLEFQISKELFRELVSIKPKYKKITINIKTIRNFKNILKNNKKDFEVLEKVTKAKKQLYKGILEPTEEYKNKANIYRIWTFYKYFIVDNYKRFYEDSLITSYVKYFKTGKTEKDIENMKKFGLSYLLMDLNAATIDNDSRHKLTERYEDLLKLILAKNVKLVSTDSICLKIAKESYEKKILNFEQYIRIAWWNYESYWKNLDYKKINTNNYLQNIGFSEKIYNKYYLWKKVLGRNMKKNECMKYILYLKKSNKIDANNFSYLSQIADKRIKQEQVIKFLKQKIWKTSGSYALFRFK